MKELTDKILLHHSLDWNIACDFLSKHKIENEDVLFDYLSFVFKDQLDFLKKVYNFELSKTCAVNFVRFMLTHDPNDLFLDLGEVNGW